MNSKAKELGNEPINKGSRSASNKMSPYTYSTVHFEGLTKREWLAGLAMQGFIKHFGTEEPQKNAEYAVEYADALLEELSKTE